MPPRKILFKIGSEIFARWPGSRMYYPGSIVGDYDNANDSYMVRFDNEGDPVRVLAKDVSKPKQVKAWRSRSASPARTPGRQKRRRSRSKSPSRVSQQKSPGRKKSPGYRAKSQTEKEPSPVKQKVKDGQVESQVKVDATNAVNDAEGRDSSKKTEKPSFVKEERSETTVTRRVTRSVARIQQTDEHEVTKEEKKEEEPEIGQHGWMCQIMALFSLILMPLSVLALCFVCGDKNQSFSFFKWPKIPPIHIFLNWKVFVAVGIWFDIQFILTKLPFGKVVNGPVMENAQQKSYRLNGFLILLLHLAVLGIHVYTKQIFKIAALVDQYYLSIATSFIIATLLTALLVAVKNSVDQKIKCQSFTPVNFLVGTETNPTIFTFDIKWCCSRAAFTSWMMLDCLFIAHHYSETNGNVNCAAVAVAVFQLIYLAGTFFSLEKQMTESPLFLETPFGFGFILAASAFTPLFYSMQVFYLVKTKPQWTPAYWAVVVVLQVVGYYIFLKANAEKSEFRSDPKKAMKRDLKVVFTQNGKNLLADGWWGRLRHPNYLGDILVSISWALPAGFNHALPWLYPVFLVAMLVAMAEQDDKRCAKKYGLSWDEYKARVQYVIIPYVY